VDCLTGVVPTVVNSGQHRLAAGVHCGGIDASGTAEIVLDAGEHWFLQGAMVIRGGARLTGSNVVLFFDRASRFDFREQAQISLEGRRTGAFAGLVMAATRDNAQPFNISADNVESLLGVIYVPSATITVEGTADVARESAWTVIVAKGLALKGSPQLYINADYDASSVPVPTGVGPRAGESRLIR
jgi:hypothetical protein